MINIKDAALSDKHALPLLEHGGEPRVAEGQREVIGEVREDCLEPGLGISDLSIGLHEDLREAGNSQMLETVKNLVFAQHERFGPARAAGKLRNSSKRFIDDS